MAQDNRWFRMLLVAGGVALLVALAAIAAHGNLIVGPAVILAFLFWACACLAHPKLRAVAFTVWVFAFVSAAMFYPAAFGKWFGADLKILIVPLIQIIMFGMGTTMSLRDFERVLTTPWAVLVGMVLQFGIMPLAGFGLATTMGFEPEIAAGIILIGSVPGGVASNVMTFLARGDVALSITMTSCSTLMSPVMTPLLMKVLAGRLVPIDFWEMLLSILNMVIVPIVAGLAANKILYHRSAWLQRSAPLLAITVAAVLAAVALAAASPQEFALPKIWTQSLALIWSGLIIGFLLIAAVTLAKWFMHVLLASKANWMDQALPLLSMMAICFIIAIITARSRQELLTVGLKLMVVVVLHNTTGYVLGYWGARLLRLNETAARTVAIEVGLQNGGMASGLAINVLQSSSAALAPAVFGPWMNISGSMLATWWHHRPVKDGSGSPSA